MCEASSRCSFLEELRAEAAVNEILGTRRVDYDDQTENGKVDFLVDSAVGSAGPHVALEVSSTIDPARQRLWHGVDRHYAQTRSDLQGDWQVQFTADTVEADPRLADGPAAPFGVQERGQDRSERLGRQHTSGRASHGAARWGPSRPCEAQRHTRRADSQRQCSRSDHPLRDELRVARSNANTITPCLDGFLASQQGMNKVRKLARHPDREGTSSSGQIHPT